VVVWGAGRFRVIEPTPLIDRDEAKNSKVSAIEPSTLAIGDATSSRGGGLGCFLEAQYHSNSTR